MECREDRPGAIFGVHSAWACHVARSSVQEMGPQLGAGDPPCVWGKPALSHKELEAMVNDLNPGAVRPYCSRTTGVMPFSKVWRL